ncbi:MAG TPA: hypothetical protein VFO91_08065 [Anaerolineales bacterium]|nr:hypothetical protein [Anaerolineales bacterium]
MKKLRERLGRFFFPSPDSPRWMLVLPYAVLGVITLSLSAGGVYGRENTNFLSFAVRVVTMPLQDIVYK